MSRSIALRFALVVASAVFVLRPADLPAQPQNLQVSANVAKRCTFTISNISFGTYDPIGANQAAALDGTGSVVVTCTRGTVATVAINVGSNAQGAVRRMAGGTSEFLTYELYKDGGRTQVWGEAGAAALVLPAAPSISPRTFEVYGRVPQSQDVTQGAYSDTAQVTVSF